MLFQIFLCPSLTVQTVTVENFAKLVKDQYFVCEFSVALSVSKTKYRGEFEEKITNCFREIAEHNLLGLEKKIIVFIDEIHTIYRAGASEGGSLDAANILKPFLSNGEIMLIGATTYDEYRDWLASDTAFVRRITPIIVKELEEKDVLKILENFCKKTVKKDVLNYIYQKSKTLKRHCNPDTSIEILDRCMARNLYNQQVVDTTMVDEILEDFVIIDKEGITKNDHTNNC